VPHLTAFLDERILVPIAVRFRRSRAEQVPPSKKLLDHVAKLIKGKAGYVLLDEQLVVYDKVVEAAKDVSR